MLNHQQYANTLVNHVPSTQPKQENPLHLKAQKNYQQFTGAARTPTYTFNPIGIGQSVAVTNNTHENMFYKNGSDKK